MSGELLTRDIGTGLQAVVDSGLLWALNEFALHGQGYEVRAAGERLLIAGCGRAVLGWPAGTEEAVDGRWRQFRQTLLDAQKYNNPKFHEDVAAAQVRTRGAGR